MQDVGRSGARAAPAGPVAARRVARPIACITAELCLGCGVCQEECPNEAIVLGTVATVDISRCTGCGACVDVCASDAIRLEPRAQAAGTAR